MPSSRRSAATSYFSAYDSRRGATTVLYLALCGDVLLARHAGQAQQLLGDDVALDLTASTGDGSDDGVPERLLELRNAAGGRPVTRDHRIGPEDGEQLVVGKLLPLAGIQLH